MPRPAQALFADPIQESGWMAQDRQSVRDGFIMYSGMKREKMTLCMVACLADSCPAIQQNHCLKGLAPIGSL